MGAISDPYEAHLHHIIPIDFNTIQTLPESHVWHDHSDESSSRVPSADPLFVPVIDLMDPEAPSLMIQACEEWGIFQVIGHGLTKLMDDVESEAEKLFGLPVDQKLKALRSPGGATGYGRPHISPFFDKHMWHEGFTIMGSPVDHAKQLWPQDYQGFCDTMDDYQNQMKALAQKLIHIFFKSLDINFEEFDWLNDSGLSSPSTALQLNSYPPCPDPTRALGMATHTDTSLVTIVQQSKTSGLQVFKDGAGWVLVQPIPGALTVNLGDYLHILSNGMFTSVRHRVVVNQQIQRFSMAYFYSPPRDFTVSPVLSRVLEKVPKYRSLTVKEYVDIKGKHLEKAFSLIQN
ncbi:gibberellin 3-beta-dioxygenase 1-like [Pyrus ussuriensis x Pyrus communis]|uniref:gibberellin 3beta-dioxygenase n=1 Tax=Pyrus ussuriensis x Pyrus communis TaxID=2448454 RepID=A0A5N5HT35_9ROSA|nr:gibberellin 3-beta-dioxygenase 1-like [Pyrus ussuriensis x Pyrus communis]